MKHLDDEPLAFKVVYFLLFFTLASCILFPSVIILFQIISHQSEGIVSLKELKITDVIVAAFTVALTFVGYFQWSWMKKGISDTIAFNRAFVFLKCVNYFSHLDTSNNKIFWALSPIWENNGNTPTKNLRLNSNFYISDSPLPENFTFPPKGNSIPTMLGPHAIVGGDKIYVLGDALAEVQNGSKFLYIWGHAIYQDVFTGTPQHITKFCCEIKNITGDPTLHYNSTTNPVGVDFSHYKRNNCRDEECSTRVLD